MFTINMRRSDAIPQSFNRYSYVQNDPVNFVDPSGLDGIDIGTFHFGNVIGIIGRGTLNGGGGGGGRREIAFELGVDAIGDLGGGGNVGGEPPNTQADRRCPPTVDQILQSRKIRAELSIAFSLSGHRTQNNIEQGGWIYQNRRGGLEFIRANAAERSTAGSIDLRNPPTLRGATLVATYHTHPFPANIADQSLREGFNGMRPSQVDADNGYLRGVPNTVVYETAPGIIGAQGAGPNRRGGDPARALPPQYGFPGNSVDNRGCP